MMRFGKKTTLDEQFMRQCMMGPNCLRLLEELMQRVQLHPGMRVLDLGCGMGLTSMFLANEFDVQVFAVDLWIEATENYERFQQLGFEDRIVPIHAEAQNLPFADKYFDAAISVDAYMYFGADPGFLDKQLAPLVKSGGTIAVSLPGLQKDFFDDVPAVLQPFWQENMNFYSLSWWKALWEQSSSVAVGECFSHSCQRQSWEEWLQCDNPYAVRDVEMMKAENGEYFDMFGLVAKVK